MASEPQKRYERLSWWGKLRLHLARDYEAFALRARAEVAEVEVRALRDVVRRYRDGWSPHTRADGTVAWRADGYYPPKWEDMTAAETAALRAATADPTPHPETP